MITHKLVAIAQVTGPVVLYLLLTLSVVSIGVILERCIYFRRRRVDAGLLGRQVVAALQVGGEEKATDLLRGSRSVEAEVLLDALAWIDDGPESVEQVLASAVKERRKGYESGLLFLGTLGNNAPFVGLFGTVLGIVTAFRELGTQQAGAMGNVMGGIAEALIATAVGILVALPAVIAYNVFQKRAVQIEENVSMAGGMVLAHLRRRRHLQAPTDEASSREDVAEAADPRPAEAFA